jgi:formylglycine-generating enzyme required for sulfatase activity
MGLRRRVRLSTLLVCVAVALVIVGGCDTQDEGGVSLLIETSPRDGAAIVIDGELAGESPLTIRGLLPGTLEIEAVKEGFRRTTKTVTIGDEGAAEVLIKLNPLVGVVNLDSKPQGAAVLLDGKKPLGKTPLLKCEVPVGEHTFVFSKENHESFTETLTIRQSIHYTRSYVLKPVSARVTVTSAPKGALVMLNSRERDVYTPSQLTLSPGTYAVGVKVDGFVVAERMVKLGPNEERRVHFKLEEGEGPPGMVLVPAGEFIFGANNAAADERPLRKIDLHAYFIDKYEVTNRQYKDAFPSHTFPKGQENRPVVGVTHDTALACADKMGKRLPTELEWEKAARGVDGREYPWGEKFDRSLCNSAATARAEVCDVGRFRGGASPYGCLDMAGNVREWTIDWYEAYDGNLDIEKDYGQMYRVLRGGSFKTPAFDVRTSCRLFDRGTIKADDIGFRCVMDVEAAQRLAAGAGRR